MTEPLRFAVVGCGSIAGAHAEAVRARDDVELVAAVDVEEEPRREAAGAWECEPFADVEELLGAAELDAACVCVPPALHAGISRRLLDAGVDVLCEKPMTIRSTDARSMEKTARRLGRTLAVSSKFLFVKDLEEAASLLDDGEIGRPVLYEVTLCSRVPIASRWNVSPELSGGGVVMDNAPHAVDILFRVLDGPMVEVDALFAPSVVDSEVEDTAEIRFQTEAGTPGRIALSWTYFTKDLDYLTVQGTEGTLRVGWTRGALRRHGERAWRSFGSGYDKAAAFAAQLDAFVAAIEGTGDPLRPVGYATRTVEMVEAVYTAAKTEERVGIESRPAVSA